MTTSCATWCAFRRVGGVCAALLALLAATAPVPAQILKGAWVDAAERRIDETRKGDLRVIVLGDNGLPVAGATVRVEQLRHDFPLGVAADGQPWPDDAADRPLWRCLNAVALDGLGGWPRVQPSPDAWSFDAVDAALAEAARRGLRVRWGGVISNDVGRVPPWAAGLHGDDLRDAAIRHVERVTATYGARVGEFDVCTDLLGYDFLQSRLGPPILRRLFEHAQAAAPRATMRARFEDALTLARVQHALEAVMALRQAFVPIDAVALEQRVGGILVQGPLQRAFEVLDGLGVSVVVAPLEVGGSSATAAAVNLETFLRTAFAERSVRGVYFAGLTADQLTDPTAALLEPGGDPTGAGQVLDRLFRDLWWTDLTRPTDELGNVYARAFAGTHRVTATLPDGRQLMTTLHLRARDRERVVVLEPMKPRR